MNPNSPVPTAAAQPVVEFIRGQRQNAAYLFLGLSALFLVGTIYLAFKAFKVPAVTEKAADTKLLDPESPEPAKTEIANPKRTSYMVGWIATLVGFLIAAAIGVFLQLMPPRPSVELQLTEARKVLLAAGGLLGCALILFGGAYFYLWSESLTKWLDKGEQKEMVWVVIPLLMVAGGAGLVFAAAQPARAEERNNLTLRRLVYGSNFGVTVLLLLVMLIVANVVIAMKVPNKLDTTETGFYTLSDTTKSFLGKLTEPATLYVILPDSGDREANDIRQFAYSAQESSDGKLSIKFVSPVSNRAELARLQDKYPRLGRDALGLLLTSGEDEKRNAFIGFEDLFEMDPRSGRPKGFAGEGKVMKELRFLADNEQKPVVYFTQGNGELSVGGASGEAAIGGSASQLKAHLEKGYIDVRPLVFPAQNPTVPDDAAVVVVIEPQTALSDASANAIRKFMNEPRKSGGKGKLIVLAGSSSGPNEKGVAKTGLEGLLAEFNVRLGDKFLYAYPTEDLPAIIAVYTAFSRAAEQSQNPIFQTLSPRGRPTPLLFPREVSPGQGSPQYQATPLLFTRPGRPTWLEDDKITDPQLTIRDLEENQTIRERKRFSTDPRPVAVTVSESSMPNPHGGPAPGGTGRVLVVGSSYVFSDRFAEQLRRSTPPSFDLLAVGIDWLRDRPPLPTDAETKKYKEYMPPEATAVDTTRLVWLPLGLGMLLIIGFGAGVWVIRRK